MATGERRSISAKGIAYPVATYQVVDTYENLGAERHLIREERANRRLDLDIDAMSAEDRTHAVAVLRGVLNRLSALERNSATGTAARSAAARFEPAVPESAKLDR